jgi:hypothetical protein
VHAGRGVGWSQHVVDHLDLHASDYGASTSFYATVLTPLGLPSWPEDSGNERATCFTRVNVVDRQPLTRGLHLCFVARSREQVEAFHQAGVAAGYRSNGAPGYRNYAQATTRRSFLTQMATTSRRSTAT